MRADMVRAMFSVREEPARGAFLEPSLVRLSGLELLRTYLNGGYDWAPIAHLTGMHPTQVDAGMARCEMPLSEWLCSSHGSISEGALIIPADSALGSAVHTTLPQGTLYTTAELSMSWICPVGPGGRVLAEGRAVHTSATMALSQVRVTDDTGQLLAAGTSRCTVFPPLPGVASSPPQGPEGSRPEPPEPWAEEPDPYLRPAEGDVLDRDVWQSSGGRDVLEAQLRGVLPQPPVHHLFGLAPVEVGTETAALSLPCTRWVCGPVGFVQGGVIALLGHAALQAAVQVTVPTGAGFAPLDLKANLLRPVAPDGRDLLARSQVVHQGRSSVIATAEVTNADGKRVALLTGSAAYRHSP